MMTLFPFEGIDDLKFADDPEVIKKKLAKFKSTHEGYALELGKKYPSLTVLEANLHIVFFPDTLSVRFFQVSGPISHNGNELHKTAIDNLSKVYTKLDPNLKTEFDGFDSPVFGFSVNKSDQEGLNDVLVYSKQYAAEPIITPEDILRHYGTKS